MGLYSKELKPQPCRLLKVAGVPSPPWRALHAGRGRLLAELGGGWPERHPLAPR